MQNSIFKFDWTARKGFKSKKWSLRNTQVNSYLSSVEEAADRTDDTGRPCSEHLQDPAGIQSPQQLLHAHVALCHLKLTLTDTQRARNIKVGGKIKSLNSVFLLLLVLSWSSLDPQMHQDSLWFGNRWSEIAECESVFYHLDSFQVTPAEAEPASAELAGVWSAIL